MPKLCPWERLLLGCCGVAGVALKKGIRRVMDEQEWGCGGAGMALALLHHPYTGVKFSAELSTHGHIPVWAPERRVPG